MQQVETMEYVQPEDIKLELPPKYVGLDEDNIKTMLINLELYSGSLNRCNETIRLYNEILQ